MSQSFLHVSDAEVAEGIEFARHDHTSGRGAKRKVIKGMRLDSDFLRMLANETGKLWCRRGRAPGGLYNAKREVLARHLSERTLAGTERFNAYSSAVSKIFSRRATFAGKARKRGTSKPPSGPEPIPVGEKDGQFFMVF